MIRSSIVKNPAHPIHPGPILPLLDRPGRSRGIFARKLPGQVLDSGVGNTKVRTNPKNDRKEEAESIRRFADRLIKEGKAKEFLVEHGFVTPTGRLTKRYGG